MRVASNIRLVAALLAALVICSLEAAATSRPDEVATEAAIVEHLDDQIDLSLQFTDQDGKVVTIGELLKSNRPLVIAPVYFECPRLCSLTQTGLLEALNSVELKLGEDYRVVSVSFDHEETPKLAKKKQEKYHSLLKDKEAGEKGWDFLVGDRANVQALFSQLGFSYTEDAGEYIHAAALMILTPDGRIARYFYGIAFPPDQFRLALVEASEGRIGETLDRLFLFCFRYDHLSGKYTLAIWNVTRIICSAAFFALFVFLGVLRLRERRAASV